SFRRLRQCAPRNAAAEFGRWASSVRLKSCCRGGCVGPNRVRNERRLAKWPPMKYQLPDDATKVPNVPGTIRDDARWLASGWTCVSCTVGCTDGDACF